jgi:hypothetical protein
MDELIESMEVCNIYKQSSIINYILSLKIDNSIKTQLLNLIDNDNYNDYITIYNICMENDIELPPI